MNDSVEMRNNAYYFYCYRNVFGLLKIEETFHITYLMQSRNVAQIQRKKSKCTNSI